MTYSLHMVDNVINREIVTTRINDNGRIVIPVEIRQQLGIKPGDTLFLAIEGGVLKIESQRSRIRRVQESLRQLIPPDRILSDELIAERREEARQEMEEWLG
ncbi:MAG: AbrB/MazE/SpoVT family DNA-binding domain-containing protein [Terracidiphilus sp.]